jgi:hypothetical protein
MTLQDERDFLMNCRLGKLPECRSYLESGGDPNVKDVAGRGAVDKAAFYSKNLELVRLLVKHGADIKGVEDHPLVLKATGGPRLSPKLKALRARYAEDLATLEAGGFEFSTIDKDEAKELKTLKVPKALIEFFCFAWPAQNPSDIAFHDVAAIKVEIESSPAEHLHPLGLVPIASSSGGDSFCIDLNATKSLDEMPVYEFYVASYEGSVYPDVLDDGQKVAGSWMEFLRYIACNRIE